MNAVVPHELFKQTKIDYPPKRKMDPTSMSVKELKETIQKAGLSYVGLAEKSELIEKAKEAINVLERKTAEETGKYVIQAEAMNVKELKEVITKAGLDMKGVTEREELVGLAAKALKVIGERKPSYFERPFGKTLLTKGGLKPTSDVLHGKKYVLIYNSAHWCPPCRQFTPVLSEFYADLKSEKDFEVVFISCDKSEAEFSSYFSTMPWTAIPFDSHHRQSAMAEYNSRGAIPELVLCSADGTVLKRGAVQQVYGDPTGDALFN